MNANDLKRWYEAMGFKNREEAAAAIGISRKTYYNFERGAPISKTVELACAAVMAGVTVCGQNQRPAF